MIQNPFSNLTPVVKNLVIINVIFYLAAFVLGQTHIFNMDQWFAAYYPASPRFRMWQIITYMFMHAPITEPYGFMHILFNMIALVSFGPILEQSVGPKRFLNLYFLCGIGALAFQVVVQGIEVYSIVGSLTARNIDPATLDYGQLVKLGSVYNVGLVGASGAVFGVVTAFAMLYPNLELMIIPIPVLVKAKYIVPAYIALELFLGLKQFAGDSVAHFAHIGGALIGFIIIKIWGYGRRNNNY